MNGDGAIDIMIASLSTAIFALITLSVLSTLFSSPAAIQPGEQFYSVQQSLKSTSSLVIPMMVVGAPAVALWIIGQMEF